MLRKQILGNVESVATLSQQSLVEKIAAASAPRAEYKKYREKFMYCVTNTNLSQEPIEEVG